MELGGAPIIDTAHRHGIAAADIRHALRNFIAVSDDPHDDDVTLFLGPGRSAGLIEVGVLSTDGGPLIIHAMAARPSRFQRRRE